MIRVRKKEKQLTAIILSAVLSSSSNGAQQISYDRNSNLSFTNVAAIPR
jgi:hypothetical protein